MCEVMSPPWDDNVLSATRTSSPANQWPVSQKDKLQKKIFINKNDVQS